MQRNYHGNAILAFKAYGIGIGIFNDNKENNQNKTTTKYEIKARKQLESLGACSSFTFFSDACSSFTVWLAHPKYSTFQMSKAR